MTITTETIEQALSQHTLCAAFQVTAAAHPRVTEWWKTIQARPAFARANIGPFVDA